MFSRSTAGLRSKCPRLIESPFKFLTPTCRIHESTCSTRGTFCNMCLRLMSSYPLKFIEDAARYAHLLQDLLMTTSIAEIAASATPALRVPRVVFLASKQKHKPRVLVVGAAQAHLPFSAQLRCRTCDSCCSTNMSITLRCRRIGCLSNSQHQKSSLFKHGQNEPLQTSIMDSDNDLCNLAMGNKNAVK